MVLFLSTAVILYSAFMVSAWILLGRRLERIHQNAVHPLTRVTILIPVRNEEAGILKLLQDLACQSYPPDKIQVIIVNDHSTDRTADIVSDFASRAPFELKLVGPSESDTGSPKKRAIATGVQHSRGQWILCTDGDCRVPPTWISSFLTHFSDDRRSFVSGPVKMIPGNGWWAQFQCLEFASLIGLGATTLSLGVPTMGNGANMAFRVKDFQSIGGFAGYSDLVSGDDQVLLHKFHQVDPDSVVFNFDPEAVVSTRASSSWPDFFQQRIRWAGKWSRSPGRGALILGLGIFGFYASWLTSLIWLVAAGQGGVALVASIILKFLVDHIFLLRTCHFLGQKFSFIPFLLSEVAYPLYTIFFGLFSQVSRFVWKGRKLDHTSVYSMPARA